MSVLTSVQFSMDDPLFFFFLLTSRKQMTLYLQHKFLRCLHTVHFHSVNLTIRLLHAMAYPHNDTKQIRPICHKQKLLCVVKRDFNEFQVLGLHDLQWTFSINTISVANTLAKNF